MAYLCLNYSSSLVFVIYKISSGLEIAGIIGAAKATVADFVYIVIISYPIGSKDALTECLPLGK